MKGDFSKSLIISFTILLIFTAVVIGGITYIAYANERSTRDMGKTTSVGYQTGFDQLTREYDVLLSSFGIQIKKSIENGDSEQEIYRNINDYYQEISKMGYSSAKGIFAYIDGNIYTLSGVKQNIKAEGQWYINTINHAGELTYSSIEETEGKKIVVASKSLGYGNIVGIRESTESFAQYIMPESMNKNHMMLIIDKKGHVLTHLCDKSGNQCIHNSRYIDSMLAAAENCNCDYFAYLDDSGKRQTVYVSHHVTGWTVAVQMGTSMTNAIIPIILMGLFVCVFVYVILTIRMIIDKNKLSVREEQGNRIIQALSNIYYEIFLINLQTCKIVPIKISEDIMCETDGCKNYNELVNVLDRIMTGDNDVTFRESFSLDEVKKLISDGTENYSCDYQRRIDGEMQWVSAGLLYDVDGLEHNEVILAIQKINYRKNNELVQRKLLINSMMDAKAANTAKTVFLSNMSHEMRTPLNAIVGFSALADNFKDNPEKLYDYMVKINRSSTVLLNLINNLLDTVKIENGAMEIHCETMDIVQHVEESADVFRSQIELAGKNFIVETDVEDRLVEGDYLRMTQILNNLVSNAAKFTKSGDTIKISLKQNKHTDSSLGIYTLTVSDTGIGMSEDFQKRLFKPFQQEHTEMHKKSGGTGLGMYIVHSMVNAMGGTLDIESKYGSGTKFRVSLSLKKVVTNQDEDSLFEIEIPDEERKELYGKKVLLVEDNELNMEIAKEILEMNGMEVTEAVNGLEAVRMFSESIEGYFDIILMDMRMPEMDGISATKEIRKMDRKDAKEIIIFAVTANAFTEDISEASSAGMNGHIAKPLDPDLLIRLIHEYTS